MKKRSLTISGHPTSIALEPQFWSALDHIASVRAISVPKLIEQIDEHRETTNLSSAIRVFALQYFRNVPPSL